MQMAEKVKNKKMAGRKKAGIIVFLLCFILAAVAAVGSVFLFPEKKTDALKGINITASGSSHPEISVDIAKAYFSDFDPCIKLRWKNNSDGRCIYGQEYDILRKSPDGEWKSTLTDNIWDNLAFILEPHSEKEEKYAVSDSVLPEAGEYRFMTWFYTENNGDKKLKHSAFVDFTLEKGVSEQPTREFSVKEMLYDNGSLSAIVAPEDISDIRITPDMELFRKTADGWERIGIFREIVLSKDNFDNRIWHSEVTDQISAVDVRSENKRAWQLYRKGTDSEGAGQLYVLLEQADGTLLFAEGEYNVSTAAQENRDSSYFQWIGMIS